MGKTITVDGFAEIEKSLNQLAAWVYKPVVMDSLKAAAQLTVDEARTLVPERTGQLKRAIRVRAGKTRTKGSFSYLAALSKKWFTGAEFYGAFQEFGWHSGKRKSFTKSSKGASQGRKKNEGEHFMEYAFESTAQRGLDLIRATLLRGIETNGK